MNAMQKCSDVSAAKRFSTFLHYTNFKSLRLENLVACLFFAAENGPVIRILLSVSLTEIHVIVKEKLSHYDFQNFHDVQFSIW